MKDTKHVIAYTDGHPEKLDMPSEGWRSLESLAANSIFFPKLRSIGTRVLNNIL